MEDQVTNEDLKEHLQKLDRQFDVALKQVTKSRYTPIIVAAALILLAFASLLLKQVTKSRYTRCSAHPGRLF